MFALSRSLRASEHSADVARGAFILAGDGTTRSSSWRLCPDKLGFGELGFAELGLEGSEAAGFTLVVVLLAVFFVPVDELCFVGLFNSVRTSNRAIERREVLGVEFCSVGCCEVLTLW